MVNNFPVKIKKSILRGTKGKYNKIDQNSFKTAINTVKKCS